MTPHNPRPCVEQYTEEIADNACHFADTARPEDWSAEAKDDVLDAIDTPPGHHAYSDRTWPRPSSP